MSTTRREVRYVFQGVIYIGVGFAEDSGTALDIALDDLRGRLPSECKRPIVSVRPPHRNPDKPWELCVRLS